MRQLKLLIKSPVVITLLLCLVVLAANIAVIGRTRPFNSDDIYMQQAVSTWKPWSGDTFYYGTRNTFLVEVPFFALMEGLFSSSRRLVIAQAEILTLSSFALFYASSVYFLRKWRVKLSYTNLLPFVWLASFGYPIVQNYLNVVWRTYDIGFSFLTFALVAAICSGRIKPLGSLKAKIGTLLACAFTGVLIYSDPYHTYFTLAPILLFVVVLYDLKKIQKSQLFIIGGSVLLSIVFAKLTAVICSAAGVFVVTDTPAAFVDFENIITNIITSVHGLLILYGADFFGRPIGTLVTIGSAINAAILGFIVYRLFALRDSLKGRPLKQLSLSDLWIVFFAGVILLVFASYTTSSLVTIGNYRYFIILMFCSVTFLAYTLATVRSAAIKLIVSALLVGATVFNLSYTFFGGSLDIQSDVKANPKNSLNYRIIDEVKSRGLTKGYASFWHGNINTYLSEGKITFLPTLCLPDDSGRTVPFKWLIDGGLYNKTSDRSFYIIDPDIPRPPICTAEQIIRQFGEPTETISIDNKTILVFDYDILTKME